MSRHAAKRKHRAFRRRQSKSWCFVYAIRETPDTPIIYVGQTRLSLDERLRWHEKAARQKRKRGRRPSRFELRMEALFQAGRSPTIEMLDRNGTWDISEAVWIDRLRARGEPLHNVLSVVTSEDSESDASDAADMVLLRNMRDIGVFNL